MKYIRIDIQGDGEVTEHFMFNIQYDQKNAPLIKIHFFTLKFTPY